jgi:hypothetical protein
MCRALLLAAIVILSFSGTRVHATDVYRCSSANGVVFQDRPCHASQAQRRVTLPDDPPAPVQSSAATDESTVPQPVPAVADAVPARVPAPAFFLCTRHDGSVYLSEDGIGGRSAVPLGMLGYPERSLADAYGGPNGIGVSAPGLRPIPHIPAAQAPLAGSYVWIDDACHFARPREACAYLRSELDTLQSKLRRAFSDDEPALKRDENSLRERLHGC